MHGLGHIGEWQASDFSTLRLSPSRCWRPCSCWAAAKLKVPALRLLILLGLVWLALAHGRHQMLLGVSAPILLAPSLAKAWPAEKRNSQARFWRRWRRWLSPR